MSDNIGVHGLITIHKVPDDWSEEEFKRWWLPVTAPNGQILQPARLRDETKREWQRPLLDGRMEAENILTWNGVGAIMDMIMVQSQTDPLMQPFAQILSAGNGTVTGMFPRQTYALPGDGFATGSRKAPVSHAVQGTSLIITTLFGSGDALGTWICLGWYGFGAASTIQGTGILLTAAAFNFVKGAFSYAVNYTVKLSN